MNPAKPSGRFLTLFGGAILGMVLGAFLGGAATWIVFREPASAASYQQGPADWYGGSLDLLNRGNTHLRNAGRFLAGGLLGASLGCLGGLAYARRSLQSAHEPPQPHI